MTAEEPVRHRHAQADLGSFAVPAVVEQRHDAGRVPEGAGAPEPRLVRVLQRGAPTGGTLGVQAARDREVEGPVRRRDRGRRRARHRVRAVVADRPPARAPRRRSSIPSQYIVCFARAADDGNCAHRVRQEPVRRRRGQDRPQHPAVPAVDEVRRSPPTTTTASTTTTTLPLVYTVSNLSWPGIAGPYDIAPGPDGALWFSNYLFELDRAGHDRRHVHQLRRREHLAPRRHRQGQRRRDVVRQHRQQHDRAASRPTGPSPTTTTAGSRFRTGSPPEPAVSRCGSPTARPTRSGG